MKLFVFPHAGGFSRYYAFLKKAQYRNIDDVVLYEYANRNPALHKTQPATFAERVERAADFITAETNGTEPYAVFGHSMGAFVAYESALLMKRTGRSVPQQIFLSGQRPPCTVEEGYFTANPDIAIPYLRSLGGMDMLLDADPMIRKFYLPIILGDLKLLETYQPSIPEPSERLKECVLLYGDHDAELDGRDLTRWTEHFERVKSRYIFSGNHFYLDQNHDRVADIINTETECTK